MDSSVARYLWRVLDPYHALVYFAPEVAEAMKAVGLKGWWMGYFAGRAAPMGPVAAPVVTATFFNFRPSMVERAIPDAWTFSTPGDVLAARFDAVDAALRRALGDVLDGPGVREAAGLAGEAMAAADLAGRPLAAAHAALPVPDPPHLALWHAATVIREHRGDGHVAALVAAGLDGCEAHVSFAATGTISRDTLQPARGWSDEEWGAAVDRLRQRGWLDAGAALTDAGRTGRQEIEDRTDQLALRPWRALGEAGTERLVELARPLAVRLIESGAVPRPNPVGAPPP